VLLARKAKKIAIGAEILQKTLLVSQDLGFFCLSKQLDHITLLNDTLLKNEGIRK